MKLAERLSEPKVSCSLPISAFSIVPNFVVLLASWSGAEASRTHDLNTSSTSPLHCFRPIYSIVAPRQIQIQLPHCFPIHRVSFIGRDLAERLQYELPLMHFYMWDTEAQKGAVKKALAYCKEHSIRVAFDIADPFAVGRYRQTFLSLIEEYCDIVFANSEEARFLFDNYDAYECCRSMGKLCHVAVVKNGRKGSYVCENGRIVQVPLQGSTNPVDTTGAGDTYAAGFLYGVAKGCDMATSGQIASYLAGQVISQLGTQFSAAKAKELREHVEKTYLG